MCISTHSDNGKWTVIPIDGGEGAEDDFFATRSWILDGIREDFNSLSFKTLQLYLKLNQLHQVLRHRGGGRVLQAVARVGDGRVRQGRRPRVHRRHQARLKQL